MGNRADNFGEKRMLTVFTAERQPETEARKKGWLKRKKAKDLVKEIMSLDFVGANPEFRENMARYFGVEPEELSVEGALVMAQLAPAINKGDTAAFNSIMDRAYGKPKEDRIAAANPLQMADKTDDELEALLKQTLKKLNGNINPTGTNHSPGGSGGEVEASSPV